MPENRCRIIGGWYLLLVGICVCQILFVGCESPTTSQTVGAIEIVGSDAFRAAVESALLRLQSQPGLYDDAMRNIGRLQEGTPEYYGVTAWQRPAIFAVHPETWPVSATWLAGATMHESCHVRQYHDAMSVYGNPPPQEMYSGTWAERECQVETLETLRRLNAPQSEIDALMRYVE